LTPATGAGTTRFCRTHQRRSSARCVAHGQSPPCEPHHAPDAAASTASRPTFVTMANAPLSERDGGVSTGDLGGASSQISENQKWTRGCQRSG
jgi:hypothetical protein